MNFSIRSEKYRESCMTTASGKDGLMQLSLQNGKSQGLKDCAVYSAFRKKIPSSERAAFAEYQRTSSMKTKWLSAKTVAAKDALLVTERHNQFSIIKLNDQ